MVCQLHTSNIAQTEQTTGLYNPDGVGEPRIFQYDMGTKFYFRVLDQTEVTVDLSQATQINIWIRKPDYTEYVVAGVVSQGGYVYHTSQQGELDLQGTWKMQATVTLPSGTWSSTVATIKVKKKIGV